MDPLLPGFCSLQHIICCCIGMSVRACGCMCARAWVRVLVVKEWPLVSDTVVRGCLCESWREEQKKDLLHLAWMELWDAPPPPPRPPDH